jgi:quercetin dioxygenase-like cupin family protein
MTRWQPHAHPFDQIVVILEGALVMEIEGETMVCEPGTILRVPANTMHTGWPAGDAPVLNIDVFPPRDDHLSTAEHQPGGAPSGKAKADTGDVLFRWNELPREVILNGAVSRAGFRGDNALVVFNWLAPGHGRREPHSHPFDQVLLILEGDLRLEIDGKTMDCSHGSIVHIPADAPHTGWVLGDQTVLNMDVFSPAREDYLHLVEYQKDFA